jgi:hypothetical protein
MHQLSNKNPQDFTTPRLWQTVAHRFPAERDCLVSFLAFESAEVLAGIKPGNLINIVNRNKPCGRNLYQLWKQFGHDLVEQSPLELEILADREHSILVYVYDSKLLATTLGSPQAQAFLTRAGYPLDPCPEKALHELKIRVKQQEFPHEIGLFLGYPLKDVEGFLGWNKQPFACQGPWKIYGDPRLSLQLADRHRSCRDRMVRRLGRTDDPFRCMIAASDSVRRPSAGRESRNMRSAA